MRHGRLRRRRTRTWWGVFFFALLVINSYVLFDILDVDGSQMAGWPGDDILAVETLHAQADRSLRAEPPTSDSASPLRLALSRGIAIDSRGSALPSTIFHIRHSRLLPRVNLRREIAPANPLSTDPA